VPARERDGIVDDDEKVLLAARIRLADLGVTLLDEEPTPKWIHVANAFDELGYSIQKDGSSTVISGLHFMGLHFQRKRKSASFLGVAEDAAVVAERIQTERRGTPARAYLTPAEPS
jgi:putative flavoprotein involved in K+ transport